MSSYSLLDMQLIGPFLLQNGYGNQNFLSSGGYAVLRSTRNLLEQVSKLRCWLHEEDVVIEQDLLIGPDDVGADIRCHIA